MTESLRQTFPDSPATVPESLLELRQLQCERDERILFSGLNLNCFSGDVVQIIGANGSGKTTLLRALAGISGDYLGEIFWRGRAVSENAWEYSADLLYLGHLPGIKKGLTPLENLRWYGAMAGDCSDSVLKDSLRKVGLYGYEDTPCYQLSAGQLRRVALARLHMSRATLWILDEPFTAIDKAGVGHLEERLTSHAAAGGIVLLTSHQDLALRGLKQLDLMDFQYADEGRVSE